MTFPYAELLEFNQPNRIRKEGFTRIRDAFPGLLERMYDEVPGLGPAGTLTYMTHYDPERIVEFAGAWDYGESNAMKTGSRPGEPIIRRWIDMGHESMLEMADATFFIECSRVVSHELVRHRIASFQQESQRFVKYDNITEFDESIYFPDGMSEVPISPSDYGNDDAEAMMWRSHKIAFATYRRLREAGVAPQIARYVLPNAMRTRLVMKTNLREWRHICKLRLDTSAQPEMQELMQQIYGQLVDVFPNVMYNTLEGERGVR